MKWLDKFLLNMTPLNWLIAGLSFLIVAGVVYVGVATLAPAVVPIVAIVPPGTVPVPVPIVDTIPNVPEIIFIGITTVSPLDFADNEVSTENIIVTFDEAMNPATVNLNTFLVKGPDNVKIEGIISSDATKKIWTFNPINPLIRETLYDITITTGAKGISGNALVENYMWSFTTRSLPYSGGGGGGTTPTPTPLVLTTISLTPATANIIVAGTQQLTAATLDQNGAAIAATVTYNTSNASVATVNSSGTVTAVAVGTTTITATSGAITNTTAITVTASLPENPTAPSFGEAGRYVILASQAITTGPGSSGASALSGGDIGILDQSRTAAYIAGFTDDVVSGDLVELTGVYAPTSVRYTSHAWNDAVPAPFPRPLKYSTAVVGEGWIGTDKVSLITQSRTDLGVAYDALSSLTNPTAPAQALPTELGGLTLTRGLYNNAANTIIEQGDLTLDGQGDPNSVWIFNIGGTGTFTTGTVATKGNVVLINSAQAKNVYWRVAGTSTIGASTTFYGNLLGYEQINVLDSAQITGRLMSTTEQVTLIGDTVTKAV